jgi:hypothetical protein
VLPGLLWSLNLGPAGANARVDGDGSIGKGQDRVHVQLGHLRQVLAERGKPVHQIDERGGIGRRRPAEAADEPTGLAGAHELLGVSVGEWDDAEAGLPDQLGVDARRP